MNVCIRPDKIADGPFAGGRLLRMRAPDKRTGSIRFLIRFFRFIRKRRMMGSKEDPGT